MAPKKDTRSRGFTFTWNNPPAEFPPDVVDLFNEAEFVRVGKEIAPTTGTVHWQGAFYFPCARYYSAIQKRLPGTALFAAKGHELQNQDYCRKEDDVVFSKGKYVHQGKRNDITLAKDIAKDTSRMKDVVAAVDNFQAIRVAEVYLKYHEAPRDWKPEVRWYYGATGEGKTRAAREWLGAECYTCLETGKFWEGYDGHDAVLIDDFRKDFCKFHVLLRILDRYEFRVEVKGASRQLRAKKIAITCPFHPRLVYETREDVGQLIRRIDRIIRVHDGVECDDMHELA